MPIAENHYTVQKAFAFLNEKYQCSFTINNSNLFEQEFNCKFIETIPYHWSIEFINKSDETVFLLRWS